MSAHEDFSRKDEIPVGSDRAFGAVFTALFALLALWPLVHSRPIRWWALPVSGGFFLATAIRPSVLHPLNRAWTRLATLLNRIVTPLVTGLLFYGVFTPMAVLFRLRGKDPLRLRFDPAAETYWLERNPPGPAPESMAHQF
ncbi:MAG: hypothetical protein LAP87_08920 [Acidobacteriia bacterium]|nr:hypothetical protein [Terriglobia bacterium]